MSRPTKIIQPQQSQQPQQKRIYLKNQELDHDLFKLKVAVMLKNESWEESNPRYIEIEHCHMFHTIDSSGRKQEACSSVGGHFHLMTISHTPDRFPSVVCSPAMRYVRTSTGERGAVPLHRDNHTHEVEYIRSDKIKPRQVNQEWLKLQSEISNKQTPPIEGVFEK